MARKRLFETEYLRGFTSAGRRKYVPIKRGKACTLESAIIAATRTFFTTTLDKALVYNEFGICKARIARSISGLVITRY